MLKTKNSGEKAQRMLSSKSVVLSQISSEWLIVKIQALEKKIGKILLRMTDSPEFDSIPRYMSVVSTYSIKMDGLMDRSSQSVAWCKILPQSRVLRI